MIESVLAVAIAAVVLIIIFLWKSAVIVPQQQVYIVERLGSFQKLLNSGVGVLMPFIDRVAYKHSLKEQALDIPEQVCITKDNVQVGVDGVIYYQVLDPKRASYGIEDYIFAITQLTQTTLRSEIGKIELDRSFEERAQINASIVAEIDKASSAWGVKVLRYEIMNINPPKDVLSAMETQMKAEREKRARVLESEGQRDAEINRAEGEKQKLIKASEARRMQQMNEAQGEASAILSVAQATAEGIECVAQALEHTNGKDAMHLRIAEHYVEQFGNLARTNNTMIIPANLADVGSMIAMAMKVKDGIAPRNEGSNVELNPSPGTRRVLRFHQSSPELKSDDGRSKIVSSDQDKTDEYLNSSHLRSAIETIHLTESEPQNQVIEVDDSSHFVELDDGTIELK